MEQPQPNTFKTTNTALAAYLISEGFNAPDIEYNGYDKASFIFDNKHHEVDKYVSDFDTLRATGNIPIFFNTYRALLNRIKERY